MARVFQCLSNLLLCVITGVLLTAEAGSPSLAEDPAYYANTCVEQESGDTAGYVVIVAPGKPRPAISFSWSEGALLLPVPADITDYDRGSHRLAFSVHADDGDFVFRGMLDPARMQGILTTPWKGKPENVELERRSGKAASETGAECRPV